MADIQLQTVPAQKRDQRPDTIHPGPETIHRYVRAGVGVWFGGASGRRNNESRIQALMMHQDPRVWTPPL